MAGNNPDFLTMTITWEGVANVIGCFLKDDTPQLVRTELARMSRAAQAYVVANDVADEEVD